jgi:carboxymethylenebutenolidase
MFGVNDHIRRVVDGYAADGYDAIAPALFDRVAPGTELGYVGEDAARARELMQKSSVDLALADIEAARATLAPSSPVAIVGYCWGGRLAWLSATRLKGFAAAAVYYGGGIGAVASEEPSCPVVAHFGERDTHIPLEQVEALRAAHPTGVEIHLYPAEHGFNCDARASFDPPSAALARCRTLAFFDRHLPRTS